VHIDLKPGVEYEISAYVVTSTGRGELCPPVIITAAALRPRLITNVLQEDNAHV
jgi:hypothetical protein